VVVKMDFMRSLTPITVAPVIINVPPVLITQQTVQIVLILIEINLIAQVVLAMLDTLKTVPTIKLVESVSIIAKLVLEDKLIVQNAKEHIEAQLGLLVHACLDIMMMVLTQVVQPVIINVVLAQDLLLLVILAPIRIEPQVHRLNVNVKMDGLIKVRKVQIIPCAENVVIDVLPAQDLLIIA
jgi:hypothetical protein